MNDHGRLSSTLALAGLLAGFGAAPSLAQDQLEPMPRPLVSGSAPMASAVSSDVARFVNQNRRDGSRSPATANPPIPNRPSGVRPARLQGGSPSPPPDPPAPTLAERPDLPAAPTESEEVRLPINLASALKLADARPLVVAAAQARTWVAEAELARAKVLWIPALNVAYDYVRHDGGGPDFNKGILTTPSTNFTYAGAGLWGYLNSTDAIFQPLVSRRNLDARHYDIQTAKNDAVTSTADAYFAVHQYRGIYAGALYTVGRARSVVTRITALSADLVQPFEVDRAKNMLADIEQQAVSARQNWRVESARLTRVLRLDPRSVVEPLERDHLQITLLDPSRPLDDLMAIALTNRPELGSKRASVSAAEINVRREKARPFIPNYIISGYQSPGGMLIQGGFFAIGPNSRYGEVTGRADVSIQLVWNVDAFGIGNLARVKQARGNQSRAIIDLRNEQDTVAADVTTAHARVQSAAARLVQADRALRTGIITLNGTVEGLEQTKRFGDVLELISRPQEAVYALQLLLRAFTEYFATVAEYNRSQFALYRALGYPSQEVALLRSPGVAAPVRLDRPAYLPPVGNGPPPATR